MTTQSRIVFTMRARRRELCIERALRLLGVTEELDFSEANPILHSGVVRKCVEDYLSQSKGGKR
jgi:hypothetical protein